MALIAVDCGVFEKDLMVLHEFVVTREQPFSPENNGLTRARNGAIVRALFDHPNTPLGVTRTHHGPLAVTHEC